MPSRSDCLNLYGLHDPYTSDQVNSAYRRIARRYHPDKVLPGEDAEANRTIFENARECKDSLSFGAENPSSQSAPRAHATAPRSRPSVTPSLPFHNQQNQIVPYVAQPQPLNLSAASNRMIQRLSASAKPQLQRTSAISPGRARVAFNSKPQIRTFMHQWPNTSSQLSLSPKVEKILTRITSKSPSQSQKKKQAPRRKSVSRSPKCNRGNRRGSKKVKGYTRHSGKRVLCYKRRRQSKH